MARLQLQQGHIGMMVRVAAEPGDTPEDVEQRVVDWLSDALDAEASRRSSEGERVIGPANPVTVIPVLGLTQQELADREARFGRNATGATVESFPGAVPSRGNAAAMVHLDWTGQRIELPTRWDDGVFSWAPTEDPDDVDVAVMTAFTRDERARAPIEPPSLLDDVAPPGLPGLPEVGERVESVGRAVVAVGVAIGIAVLLAAWGRR